MQVVGSYCQDNSGWACNELGTHYAEGRIVPSDATRARDYFSRACELRFQPGCINLLEPGAITRASPRVLDLRLLLREGGLNLIDMPESQLYARACEHGWSYACARPAASN
jgi:TPR repeat protein